MLTIQDLTAVLGVCLASFQIGYLIGYKIAKK